MSSAWLLPEHIADVLPSQARRIEELRRTLLDVARSYGCELVMPPLLEHLESLLSGTGRELDLLTFKLVDQLSGRTVGVRADTTTQVARIDAHLLNRQGVTRLCYCGPVLHTLPDGLQSTREPLQFGAEIYGHAGLEADLEVQDLALDALAQAGVSGITLDLGDARIVRGVLAGLPLDAVMLGQVYAALAAKDTTTVDELSASFPDEARRGLHALTRLYGGAEVIDAARRELPARPLVTAALNDLEWLARHLKQAHPQVNVGFDLADLRGYAYYSGAR
ncbi:MAG: hisZ, partial [Rhizobacter sp.]|nr:hisZ [Rhizobacter sp.]